MQLKPHMMRVYIEGRRGKNKISVINTEGAYKLIMMLPKTPILFKCKSAQILKRYLDGDNTLSDEILQNQAMGPFQSHMQFAQDVMDETAKLRGESGLPEICYVYACASPAFPDLIKIGKTNDLVSRLSSLNTSCAPTPHKYVAVAQSLNYSRDEKMTHAFFAYARKEGEFFAITVEEVTQYFEKNIEPLFQIELKEYMLHHSSKPSGSGFSDDIEMDEDEGPMNMQLALNNTALEVQKEILMVKMIKPLEMMVGDQVKSFRCVEVPGVGSRLLMYDIIMGVNHNTQNAAGTFYRILSIEKKNEVFHALIYNAGINFFPF